MPPKKTQNDDQGAQTNETGDPYTGIYANLLAQMSSLSEQVKELRDSVQQMQQFQQDQSTMQSLPPDSETCDRLLVGVRS